MATRQDDLLKRIEERRSLLGRIESRRKALAGELDDDPTEGPKPERGTTELNSRLIRGEQEFQTWYADKARELDLDPDPDNPRHFYDYRAAFHAGVDAKVIPEDGLPHWPSEYKRLGHPNLIVDGRDTRTGERATDELRAASEAARARVESGDRAPRFPRRHEEAADATADNFRRGPRGATAAEATMRGLSEVGHRTAIGASELVGADKTAANLRASRELAREFYGEPRSGLAKSANVVSQLVGEGALFMAPGAGAERVLAERVLGGVGKANRFLRLLAAPEGFGERAAQTFVTGAPLDYTIAQAGPEESMAGAAAELSGSPALEAIARDPVKRGLFEVAAGFGMGELLGEVLGAVGRAAAESRVEKLGTMAARAEASGVRSPELVEAIEALPTEHRQRALEAFAAEQDRLRAQTRENGPGEPRASQATEGPVEPTERSAAATGPRSEESAAPEELAERIEVRREALGAEEPASVNDAVPWSRRSVEPEATGSRQRTIFPGDDSKVETEYAVLEADDVRASHTPDFAQRAPEEFPPEIQGRAYHGTRGRQAREHTESIVSGFDPDRAFDATVSAADGPPVVTRQGINVAGNGRTIAQQRLYRVDPERGQRLLKDELVARAEQFGLDPEEVRGMERPILVRRIVDEGVDQLDTQALRRLNQASDVPSGKAKDVLSDAASRAEQFRSADRALRHFAETAPEDATIRSYLDSKDGTEFLRRLIDDGVISKGERARFIDATTGSATQEGKQLVERMFYAAAIGDADVVARAPDGILRKLDTSLPAMIRSSRVEGFELSDTVQKALDLLARARAEDLKLDDLIAQADFTRPAAEPQVAAMARFLEGKKKSEVRDAFRSYAEEAEAFTRQSQSDDLFGYEPTGPEEAGQRFAAMIVGDRQLRRPDPAALEQRQTEAFESVFSKERVLEAKTPEEFLRRSDEDPRVQAAQKRPQPGPEDTWSTHGGENPTPERAAQREAWFRTLDENAGFADPADRQFEGPIARDRKAVLILGPPAAGKSTVADPLIRQLRARVLDADEAKKLIPEFDGGKNAGGVHEESSAVMARQLVPAIERGENIVWPTLGGKPESVRRKINELVREGYEVHVMLNEIPALEAARRAYLRFLKTERYVDFRYILEGVGDRPSRTYEMLRDLPELASARRYSNDVPFGEPPKLLEERGTPLAGGPRGDRGQAREQGAGRAGGTPRRVRETAHPLVPPRDLFGEVAGEVTQGELLPGRGPQGMTAALDEARATVSHLEGRVERGVATDSEVARYEEARSLIRRSEGRGLDAGEVNRMMDRERARRELRAGRTPTDNRDLFDNPLAPEAGVSERLPSAGRFYENPVAADADLVSPKAIVDELGSALDKALGLKVAEGGLPAGVRRQGAVGVFDSKTHVLRQKDVSDVGVFGHEAGHAMQQLFFGRPGEALSLDALEALPGAIRGELEDMARGISDGSLREGWAELWRRFLDNPEALEREAPNALRFVEDRLGEFPAVKNAWEVARDDWRAYRESSAQARVGAKISVGDRDVDVLSLEDRWSRFRTAVLDDLEPIRRVVEHIRQNAGIETMAEDAETLARLSRGSVGAANMFLEHGALDFNTLERVGPGLKEIIEPVKDQLDDFRRYIVAKHAQALHADDILTGFRDADVNTVVRELEEKFGESFRPAWDGVQKWNDQLLQYLVDSGVVSRDAAEAMRRRGSYIPFYRVREGKRVGRSLGQTFGHLFSPTKRIRGSGRDVIDPLESLVKNAMLYTHVAQQQQVSAALAALADKPGVGKILEQIGTPIRPTKFRLGEIEPKLRDAIPGLDELLGDLRADLAAGAADPAEELLAVFRPGDYIGRANTISVLKDGKRTWYEVSPELYGALQGLERESLDAFARWMGAPARFLRAGATLAPEFQIRNPLRDQVMAFIQSEYGYTPFVDMARGMFELMKKGEAYQQWLSAGGYRAALTSLDRNSMQNAVRSLLKEGGVRNVVKSPLDALRALSALMEDSTRMGEFLNARAVEGTTKEGLQRAAAASREVSIDFARHGAKTTFLRHVAAFWNARLQGYDRLARAAKRNPARFAVKAFSAITVPSLMEYYINRDDPDYWEQPQWKRDLFWMVKVGDDWLSIPKPFELGLIFGTLPVRVLDSYAGGPGGAKEVRTFFESTLLREAEGMIPGPTAVMPLIENTTNYSFFLQRPIVPRSQEEVEDRYQVGGYTSEVAELLARWIPGEEGVSPRTIDNLLYAWTGGLGRVGTELVDPLLGAGEPPEPSRRISELPGIRGVMDQPPGFGSESIERFYDEYERARVASSTLRYFERTGDDAGYERELQDAESSELRSRERMYRRTADQLSELRAEADAIRRDPGMDPDEKRRQIEELGRTAMEVARAALGRELPGSR